MQYKDKLKEELIHKLNKTTLLEGLDAKEKNTANVVVQQLKKISASLNKLESSAFQEMTKNVQEAINSVQEYISKTDEEDLSWFGMATAKKIVRGAKEALIATPLTNATLLIADLENAVVSLGDALKASLPDNIEELLQEDPELTVQEALNSNDNVKAAELIAKRWNASFKQAKNIASISYADNKRALNNVTADDILPLSVQELIDLVNIIKQDEVGEDALKVVAKDKQESEKSSKESDVRQYSDEDLKSAFEKVNKTLKSSNKNPKKFAAMLLAAGLDPSKLG